jgi:hypothetical protein
MKKLVLGVSLTVALAAVAAVGLLLSPPAPVTAGVASQLHLELVAPGAPDGLRGSLSPLTGPIPPAGSPWHELYPSFCGSYTQEGYSDNGDGVISACDIIRLSGVDYHIVWAGPTYWTTCQVGTGPPTPVALEPTEPTSGGNPVCEVWHEVYPNFCQEIHIDNWDDNGDGVVSPCDVVINLTPNGPATYHIDRIECNITIEPVPVPVKPSTWSRIKQGIEKLF